MEEALSHLSKVKKTQNLITQPARSSHQSRANLARLCAVATLKQQTHGASLRAMSRRAQESQLLSRTEECRWHGTEAGIGGSVPLVTNRRSGEARWLARPESERMERRQCR